MWVYASSMLLAAAQSRICLPWWGLKLFGDSGHAPELH